MLTLKLNGAKRKVLESVKEGYTQKTENSPLMKREHAVMQKNQLENSEMKTTMN